MTEHYREHFHRDIDYLVALASKNIREGIIEEPRVYYDTFVLQADQIETPSKPDIFINGEQFPVVITHMAAAIRPDYTQAVPNPTLDERYIQRMGLRLTFHDQYYQSRDFVPLPLWLNKVVAAGDLVTEGTSAWTLDRPFVLSARDSMRVTVALEAPNDDLNDTRRATVSFTGTGMLSKRPYFLSQSVELSDTTPVVLPTQGFRNDGAEPVAITDMAVHLSGETNAASAQGDIRRVRVNVRQIGNGTQADWMEGPTVPAPLNECPASLLGVTSGRALIHRFPGKGLLWEPGEGVTMDAVALDPSVVDFELGVALLGYISVV